MGGGEEGKGNQALSCLGENWEVQHPSHAISQQAQERGSFPTRKLGMDPHEEGDILEQAQLKDHANVGWPLWDFREDWF